MTAPASAIEANVAWTVMEPGSVNAMLVGLVTIAICQMTSAPMSATRVSGPNTIAGTVYKYLKFVAKILKITKMDSY